MKTINHETLKFCLELNAKYRICRRNEFSNATNSNLERKEEYKFNGYLSLSHAKAKSDWTGRIIKGTQLGRLLSEEVWVLPF